MIYILLYMMLLSATEGPTGVPEPPPAKGANGPAQPR